MHPNLVAKSRRHLPLLLHATCAIALLHLGLGALGYGWWLDTSRHAVSRPWHKGQYGSGLSSEGGRLIVSWRWGVYERAADVDAPDVDLGPSLVVGELRPFTPPTPHYTTARAFMLWEKTGYGNGFSRLGIRAAWEPSWSVNAPMLNRGIAIHWGWIAAVSGVPLLWHHRAALRRRCLEPTHRCPTCGYDLRATPDRCPECRMAITPNHSKRR
jgi:hypothetical protein